VRINDVMHRLASLIRRIKVEMVEAEAVGVRTYGIKDDFVSLQEEELGGCSSQTMMPKNIDAALTKHTKWRRARRRISRSAAASLIHRTMLRALDVSRSAAEKDFSKRLAASLTELRQALEAKPAAWELHVPADLLPDKLPCGFGKCEFYLGDVESVHRLFQRIGCPEALGEEESKSLEVSEFVKEAVDATIPGKVVISVSVHAVDATAAQILGQKLIRQTVDILSFFANLGGQARSQILLPEDSRPGIAKAFLFSETGERHAASALVGPIAPFSFSGPHLNAAGLERTSGILKSETPSEFELRLLAALQWAGKASVESRREEAFLLFAVSFRKPAAWEER
jgi:hypothetical protein